MTMWKQQPSAPGSYPEPQRPNFPSFDSPSPTPGNAGVAPQRHGTEGSIVTAGMTVRGEITGLEAIYVDGTIEGEINIPGERVTIGPNGRVASTSSKPCISAREIIVMGTVRGNIVATDRLEIRSSGSIMGNVTTARLKVEDGSHFQGGIDICEPEPEPLHESAEDADPVEMQHSRYDYAEARY